MVERITLQNYRKNLLKRVVLASVVFFVLFYATYAWLRYNEKTNAEGMSISLEVGPHLIIGETPEELQSEEKYTIVYTDTARNVDVSTHDWSISGNSTGLKYILNPNIITTDTGLPATSKVALKFDSVPEESTDPYYYVDYVAYVASVKETITVNSFLCELSEYAGSSSSSIGATSYQNAASMDFYIDSVSETNYRGTLNLAGLTYENTSTSGKRDVRTQIDLVKTGNTMTIPLNTSGNSLKIIMRVYLDGGLIGEDATAFVKAKDLSLSSFGMKVNFTATKNE